MRVNSLGILIREKSLLKSHFPFLDVSLQPKHGRLIASGYFQPTELSITYEYRVIYKPPNSAKVIVDYPVIEYNDDIHMYPKDNSLCLYHKSDLKWDCQKHSLYEYTIPWTHEWFVYYELYLITGEWKHPYVPHGVTKKQR